MSPRSNPLVPLAVTLLPLLACSGEPPSPPETYEARGIVRQLGAGETPELLIHHEALPEFRNQKGEAVGMEAMAMPFPVAEAALVDGVEVGDRIAFSFEVRWDDGPPLLLTHLETLGPEERLDFELPTDSTDGDNDEAPDDSTEAAGHDHHHEGMEGSESPANETGEGATQDNTSEGDPTEGSSTESPSQGR